MSGKGDTPRPVDGEKFREHYDRIFSKVTTPPIEPLTIAEAQELIDMAVANKNHKIAYEAMLKSNQPKP